MSSKIKNSFRLWAVMASFFTLFNFANAGTNASQTGDPAGLADCSNTTEAANVRAPRGRHSDLV
jgi:hypothetical protein